MSSQFASFRSWQVNALRTAPTLETLGSAIVVAISWDALSSRYQKILTKMDLRHKKMY